MGRGALSIFLGHYQVHETSLSDACSLRKAEGLGRAKILGLVQDQNLIAQFIALCSSHILAEMGGIAAAFVSASRAQRRDP